MQLHYRHGHRGPLILLTSITAYYSGWYIYNDNPYSNTPVMSPPIRGPGFGSNNDVCIEFFYYVGGYTATLNVYLRKLGETDLGDAVWSRTRNRADLWRGCEYRVKDVSDFDGKVEQDFQVCQRLLVWIM